MSNISINESAALVVNGKVTNAKDFICKEKDIIIPGLNALIILVGHPIKKYIAKMALKLLTAVLDEICKQKE